MNKINSYIINSKPFFKKEFFFISLILIALTLIFSSDVVFTEFHYTNYDHLARYPPWDQYPPEEFGNYNYLKQDVALNGDPYRKILYDAFYNGEFPVLWNPDSYAGSTFIHGPYFQPIRLLFLLLPYEFGFEVTVLVTLFIAGIGSYYFLRELDCNIAGSLAASISYMFSGAIIIPLTSNTATSVLMVMPLVFLFIRRLVKEPSWKNFVFLSLSITGIILGGHLETAAIIFYVFFLYFIFQLALTIKNKKSYKNFRLPALFLGSNITALLISSIHLIPFSDNMFKSLLWIERTHAFPSAATKYHHMITTLLPEYFGRPTYGYWDSPYFNPSNNSHVGIISLVLASIGIIFLFIKNHEVKFFSIISIVLLGISFSLSGFKEFFHFFPTLNLMPSMFAGQVFPFSISVVTGFGVYYLSQKKLDSKLKITVVIIALMIFFGGIATFFTITSLENPPTTYFIFENPLTHEFLSEPPELFFDVMKSELIIFLVLLGSLCVFIILKAMEKLSTRVFTILVISLLALSGLEFGMSFNQTSLALEPPVTPSIEFLQNDQSIHRVLPTGTIMEPDSHLMYGISSIRSNDLLRPPIYMDVFRSLGNVRGSVDMILDDYSSPLLNLINVKYVLINSYQKLTDYDGRYEVVFQDKSIKILENKDVLPRAFMVYDFEEIHPTESPKNWSQYQFLKGWIKGSGNEEMFEITLYGPTEKDLMKFNFQDELNEWKEFKIDLSNPVEISGNPNISKIIKMEILGSSISENDVFKIKELQLTNDFQKLQNIDNNPLWSLQKYDGGKLGCSIDNPIEGISTIEINRKGNNVECFFFYNFPDPTDLSQYHFFEYWMNNVGAYELYIFGPTMNDFQRYDVYQYSPIRSQFSKVNINLDAPIEIHGNPDLSQVIQIRIDPGTGRTPGGYSITEPILHKIQPLEILYKSHHLQDEKVDNKNGDCSILDSRQLIGSYDPRFKSKIPSHQPKDLFYFEKKIDKINDKCMLSLTPSYSETLLILNNLDFDYEKQIIINDVVEDNVKNSINFVQQSENEVEILDYKNENQKLRVTTSQPGFLFISDMYDEHWHAYIDGEESKIYRTNWAFRSIFVPEGEHLIEFKYESQPFLFGSVLTLLGLLVLVVGSLIQLQKQKFKK